MARNILWLVDSCELNVKDCESRGENSELRVENSVLSGSNCSVLSRQTSAIGSICSVVVTCMSGSRADTTTLPSRNIRLKRWNVLPLKHILYNNKKADRHRAHSMIYMTKLPISVLLYHFD
jgi:hypothetical protein